MTNRNDSARRAHIYACRAEAEQARRRAARYAKAGDVRRANVQARAARRWDAKAGEW